MKRFKEISEQHREKGKFKPVKPYNVADVSPRPSSDSANVNLKEEGWSQKYKNSIDCNNPKGFSQKAHCAGKKKSLSEDLRRWFSKTDPKGGWKRINSKGEAIGPCAREPGEPKPKCMSNAQRASLSKKERASAVRRKRREDPNPERQGEPINVKSKVNEDMDILNEKNKPTNPGLWSKAIAQARAKFDVYPSAYANGWASKWYKEHGGGWKSVSEANEVGDDPINQGTPEGIAKKGSKTVANKTLDNMKEDTDAPPIHVRSLYAQTYAKHGKTASQSKAAQELAYRAVEKKHGPDMRKKLSDYHNKNQNESVEIDEGAIPSTEKTVTVKHETSGKELVVTAQKAKDYQKQGYHPVKEEVEQIDELRTSTLLRYATKANKSLIGGDRNKEEKRIKGIRTANYKIQNRYKVKEEVEQIEEVRKMASGGRDNAGGQYYDIDNGDGTIGFGYKPGKSQPSSSHSNYEMKPEPKHPLHGKIVTAKHSDGKEVTGRLMGTEHQGTVAKIKHSSGMIHSTDAKTVKKAISEMKEEVEQIDEGRPSQRHPLEGHEYHKKSDEALIHIAKDAHAAAEAMKGHNTTAENKYRDQANDSATVRHYRKTHGMADWYKKKYGHVNEAKDEQEYGYEGDMAMNQLKTIIRHSEYLMEMMEPDTDLPEWVQSKITLATDYIQTACDYMTSEMNEEVEQIDEAVEKNTKPPFDAPYTKRKSTGPVVDKSGAKHGGMSIARHLARMAAQKQAGNIKEEKEKSRKAQIVKDASKKKDKFESDPIITDTTVKTDNLQ